MWLSPNFPVGAYAYSHGLEWSVQAGEIGGAAHLADWLAALFDHGAPRSDALLLAAAWRAVTADDAAAFAEVSALALALAPSQERRLETSAQGAAFLAAATAAWPCPALAKQQAAGLNAVAYPVALALAAAGHDIALQPTLEAFLSAAAGNLVSAALRLGAIGQTEGQRILADLCAPIAALAAFACESGLDDLGSCAWRADIASMRHETLYSRLFRS